MNFEWEHKIVMQFFKWDVVQIPTRKATFFTKKKKKKETTCFILKVKKKFCSAL